MRVLLGLLLVLSLTSLASAQSVAPAASLALSMPAGPVTIELGMTHEIQMDLSLRLENIVCAQEGNATVDFTVKDVPSPLSGVKGTVAAPSSFKVPAGAYLNSSAYQGKASNKFRIEVGTNAPGNHTHQFQVTANFPGGTVSGCQNVGGALPAVQALANHTIMTGPSAGAAPAVVPGQAGSSGATSTPASQPAAQQKQNSTPFGVEILFAGGILAAALRRRR